LGMTSKYERVVAGSGGILLDGAVGGEIRNRSPPSSKGLLPASILFDDPHLVRQLHQDYIAAGARVITTNTYATVRKRMQELLGNGELWEQAVQTALDMAKEAVEASGEEVLIAGTLPPLHGSYNAEGVGEENEIRAVYAEHVALMQDHVDVFLCETMSSGLEARVALTEAQKSGKPVWVSWTIKGVDGDQTEVQLFSQESLDEAWECIKENPPEAVLVNCCTPETLSAALPALQRTGVPLFGGHANGLGQIPKGWKIQEGGYDALGTRQDLTPEMYACYGREWRDAGARIIGGCCEIGIDHIVELNKVFTDEATVVQ